MFKFIKLKSINRYDGQGPWGPWAKKKNDEQGDDNQETIEVNQESNNNSEPPKNDDNKKKKDKKKKNKKKDKKIEENQKTENKEEEKIENIEEKTEISEIKSENEGPKEEKEENISENKNIFGDNVVDINKKEEESNEENIISPWGNNNPSNNQNNNAKYDKIIKDLIGNKNNGGSNSGGGSDGGDFYNKFSKAPKKFMSLLILGLVSLWLVSGFYKVEPDENAIVLYFGKFHGIATPGLNYHLPTPIGKIVKQSVTTVNSEEFGYKSSNNKRRFNSRKSRKKRRNKDIENLMLTGDENIVDIEFQVQWQISDIEEFTFNIASPRLAIRQAAQSAMREIIATTPISEALSDGKSRIEQETKTLLQQTLDSYSSGIRIVLVQLRRVDPPSQVIDSFRDVQTARADKEREINESQAYANDIIPRARGNAAEMEQKAEAYKQQVEADALGEAKRFSALYYQYKNAKEVTRKRIYLETMKRVYGDIDKIIIDKDAAKGSILPYLPLNDLNRSNIKQTKVK